MGYQGFALEGKDMLVVEEGKKEGRGLMYSFKEVFDLGFAFLLVFGGLWGDVGGL